MLNCKNCSRCSSIKDQKYACPFYQGRLENVSLKDIEKAAHKDKAAATYLAACLVHGHRIPRNERKAKALLEKLARERYAPAEYLMALCYFLNPTKPAIKPERAIQLCEDAAFKHCNLAAIQLYHCYLNGHTVNQDYKQAGKWCKSAAEDGSTEVYQDYAEMCHSHKWGVYNLKTACTYYEHLLRSGNEGIRDQLKELCYECAEDLCKNNIAEACVYYEKAQHYGNTAAHDRLVQLHKEYLESCYPHKPVFAGQYDFEKEGDYFLNNPYAPNVRKALSSYKTGLNSLIEPESKPEDKNPLLELIRPVKVRQTTYYGKTEATVQQLKEKIKRCYSILLTESDNSAGRTLYEKAAAGDAVSQFNLACLFGNKTFELFDLTESVDWYRLSAEQGYVLAQYNLGICYFNGQGVPQDYTEAVRWYRLAAEQGDANAQCILGACYFNGIGFTKDYTEAAQWYRLSAEQGNADAQNYLGACYYNGCGVEKDYAEATKWYYLAAEQGNVYAQTNLGFCYYSGYGMDKNYAEAVKWYTLAAQQGNAYSQFALGCCYENGHGTDQNYCEAVKWYTLAAKQDYADAQYNLGNCYYIGLGVERNYSAAFTWFKLAANQGHANACCGLGILYHYGNGVKQDYKEAMKWYELAAQKNVFMAEKLLRSCKEALEKETEASTFYETETWEDPLRYYVPPQQDTGGDLTDDEAWWAIASGMMSVDSTGM